MSAFTLLVIGGCQFFKQDKVSKLPQNWEMIEMFTDEIAELNEGGYYGLYYNHDNPEKDSLFEDSDDRIVAIVVADSLIVGQSTAKIWVADSKQILTLESNDAVFEKSYHRVYANQDFTVSLTMKFCERIDGVDEADMLIYCGKMLVTQNGTTKSQEFKVKGGI
jgi:hypothetical protein